MEEGSTTVKRRKRLGRESNPILLKELRGRMRGARAFIVLTVYLLLLSCFTAIIYYAYSVTAGTPGGGSNMAYLGKVVFSGVVLVELFMVTFITPALTAGAVSGERERKTYELLRTTLLSARRLVTGKLASALTYMFLLILAAVPMESLAFMLGGVVMEELSLALIILLVTAFAFAAFGIFFSAFTRTTLASTVLAYATALLTTVGLPVLLIIALILTGPVLSGYGSSTPSWTWQVVLLYASVFLAGLGPISAAIGTEIILESENAILYFWYEIDPTHHIPVPSPWTIYTMVYLALAMVLLLVAVLKVQRQETR